MECTPTSSLLNNRAAHSSGSDESGAVALGQPSLRKPRDYHNALSRPSSSAGSDTATELMEVGSATAVPPDTSTTTSQLSRLIPAADDPEPNRRGPGQITTPASVNDDECLACTGESQPLKGAITTPCDDLTDGALQVERGRTESIWRTWWLEMFSSLLALACIIAIVAILHLHHGKPLPDWPGLMSVNSTVAIFTAIFKASIILPIAEGLGQLKWNWFRRPQRLSDVAMFDSASRGPWGSLLLVMKQLPRPHRSYLAVAGSLITIAALAIDPISQAMIEHKECSFPRDPGVLEFAQVPRTNNYTANKASRPSELEWAVDPTMDTALNKGLMDPEETDTQIKFRCTTGNCTFGQGTNDFFLSSLAMCNSCEDITSQVVENRSSKAGGSADGRHWHLPFPKDSRWPFTGPHVYNSYGTPKVSVTPTPGHVDGYKYDRFLSFDILMITIPSCKGGSKCDFVASRNVTPVAARCRLYPCVKRYRGQVISGIYSETEDGRQPPEVFKPSPIGGINEQMAWVLVTNTTLVDGEVRQCPAATAWTPNSVKVDSTYGSLYGLANVADASALSWSFYPQECVWCVGYTAWVTISHVLKGLLENNVTSVSGTGVDQVNGPIWLRRAYDNGSGNLSTIKDMIRGLTNSMTAAIRNNPGDIYLDWPALDDAQRRLRSSRGSISNVQTCVYVHWGWVAYPVTLLVLQWAFTALVLTSQELSVGNGGVGAAWKSSTIALLLHGLDRNLRRKTGSLVTLKDMDGFANRVNVRLGPDDDSEDKGWKFHES